MVAQKFVANLKKIRKNRVQENRVQVNKAQRVDVISEQVKKVLEDIDQKLILMVRD